LSEAKAELNSYIEAVSKPLEYVEGSFLLASPVVTGNFIIFRTYSGRVALHPFI
jgi:hypothetical protein